jgi:purine-binding chemotaxis protein CheW
MSEPTDVVSEDDWEHLAREASNQHVGEDAGIEQLRELLAFDLCGSPYAIPVERVREIVRFREIRRVPKVPSWMRGVVALRGEVVQVVDLRMKLGLEAQEPNRRSRIIVLHGDDDRITGILVDAVREVLRINEEAFASAVNGEIGAVSELCLRADEFVSVIDIDRVLELRAD